MVDIILVNCKIVAKIRCKMDRPGFLLLMRQHFSQSAESPTPFSFSEKENSLTENEKKKENYNFDEYSAPAGRRLNLFNLFSIQFLDFKRGVKLFWTNKAIVINIKLIEFIKSGDVVCCHDCLFQAD